jgi:hypothetical protein
MEQLLASQDTYQIIDACLNEPTRILVSWRFMLGDKRISVTLDPLFERLDLYREEYPDYVSARVLAAYSKDLPQDLIGFEFDPDSELIKKMKKLSFTSIKMGEDVVQVLDSNMQATEQPMDLSSPFSDLVKLKVWKRYAGAVYGAMGVTISGEHSLGSFLNSVEEKVEQNLVRRQKLLNDSMNQHLDELETSALREIEKRMKKQYNSVIIDVTLDSTFMEASDSKAWAKLTRREKTIKDFEEGASAIPSMDEALQEMRRLSSMLQRSRGNTSPIDKKPSRSPSPEISPISKRPKTVAFADSPVKEEKSGESKKRVRSRPPADRALKHQDSGMIYKEGSNMVLVCADGSKVGVPAQRVRQMLPPELRARACLETAVSNQTGNYRMKWCPHKDHEGHRNMQSAAHAGLPLFVSKMFKQEAKPLP